MKNFFKTACVASAFALAASACTQAEYDPLNPPLVAPAADPDAPVFDAKTYAFPLAEFRAFVAERPKMIAEFEKFSARRAEEYKYNPDMLQNEDEMYQSFARSGLSYKTEDEMREVYGVNAYYLPALNVMLDPPLYTNYDYAYAVDINPWNNQHTVTRPGVQGGSYALNALYELGYDTTLLAVQEAARADGLETVYAFDLKDAPKQDGKRLVALFYDAWSNRDLWMRQDADGTWSYKVRSHEPVRVDTDGKVIKDPREAKIDLREGYYSEGTEFRFVEFYHAPALDLHQASHDVFEKGIARDIKRLVRERDADPIRFAQKYAGL